MYTLNDVLALGIAKNPDETQQKEFKVNDQRQWLPPESALSSLSDLIQLKMQDLEFLLVCQLS